MCDVLAGASQWPNNKNERIWVILSDKDSSTLLFFSLLLSSPPVPLTELLKATFIMFGFIGINF